MLAKAKELFDAGKLSEAIDEITGVVKIHPRELDARAFLFELLSFAGEWVRAEKQLEVIASQNPAFTSNVEALRQAVHADRVRQRLLLDGPTPMFATERPDYVDLQLAAVRALRAGDQTEAGELLTLVYEKRPVLPVKVNGQPYPDFRDYDDLIGPVLEVFLGDKYLWLPFEHIKRIEIASPSGRLDLRWLLARIETRDASVGIIEKVVLPALYLRTSQHANEQVRLGRITEWQSLGDSFLLASGLRMFLMGDQDQAIHQISSIEFG